MSSSIYYVRPEIEHIPIFLGHERMDADCREVPFIKQTSSLHNYHKFVEIKRIQEIPILMSHLILFSAAKTYIALTF
jgi:hypothetical protein